MKICHFIFSFLVLFSTLSVQAQRNFNEFNVIGISGGINIYDITTSDLNTQSGQSFMAGFQMRGNVYNNFDMLYGIAFYDTKVSVATRPLPAASTLRNADYAIQSAQISVLAGYKIIREHLSIEAGPVLNINGKLALKDDQFGTDIVDGYLTTTAKDLEDISKINFHLAAGMTAGMRNLRVFFQYQYGVTNMLNNLNKKELENTNFKGNSSLIVFGATVYL